MDFFQKPKPHVRKVLAMVFMLRAMARTKDWTSYVQPRKRRQGSKHLFPQMTGTLNLMRKNSKEKLWLFLGMDYCKECSEKICSFQSQN
jgi:hypothetical protein